MKTHQIAAMWEGSVCVSRCTVCKEKAPRKVSWDDWNAWLDTCEGPLVRLEHEVKAK